MVQAHLLKSSSKYSRRNAIKIFILLTELPYYAHSHKTNKLGRPDLFRLNGISHEKKLTNLAIFLSEDCVSAHTVADLPTNDDVIAVLEGTTTEQPSNEPRNIKINEHCVVVWRKCDAGYEWLHKKCYC